MTWNGEECCSSVTILDKVPLFRGSNFSHNPQANSDLCHIHEKKVELSVLTVFRARGCRSAGTTTRLLFPPGGITKRYMKTHRCGCQIKWFKGATRPPPPPSLAPAPCVLALQTVNDITSPTQQKQQLRAVHGFLGRPRNPWVKWAKWVKWGKIARFAPPSPPQRCHTTKLARLATLRCNLPLPRKQDCKVSKSWPFWDPAKDWQDGPRFQVLPR